MHVSTRSHARSAAIAALVAAVLTGCGPAAPPNPPAATGEPMPTAMTAPPSPTASASPSPSMLAPSTPPTRPAGRVFETQNGTMRVPLPEGWTVRDGSRLGTDLSGRPMWENIVAFTSPSGIELGYSDGFGADVGYFHTDYGVVEERPTGIAADVSAMSWWVQDSGRCFVNAAVATRSPDGTEPIPQIALPDVERNHVFSMVLLGSDQPSVGSREEAERLLGGAEVLEALDVLATLELSGVDASAMPPGIEP